MKTTQKKAEDGVKVNQRKVGQKAAKGASLADASRNGEIQRKLAGMIQCADDPFQSDVGLEEEDDKVSGM